jgi:hypothetical protein
MASFFFDKIVARGGGSGPLGDHIDTGEIVSRPGSNRVRIRAEDRTPDRGQ